MPVSLKDLVAHPRIVQLAEGEVTVRGLTLGQIGALMQRFDGVPALMGLGDPAAILTDPTAEPLINAVIAAGLRCEEEDAANVVAGDQAALLLAIIDLTLPRRADQMGELASLLASVAVRSVTLLANARMGTKAALDILNPMATTPGPSPSNGSTPPATPTPSA